MTRILFRCDGTDDTGLGHVSRCLSLAEAASELGASPIFVGRYGGHARMLLADARMPVAALDAPIGSDDDAATVRAFAAGLRADRVVVDGYSFDAEYMESLVPYASSPPLFVIDDAAALARYPRRSCVLSFTARAGGLVYTGDRLTVLRGPGYLLARRTVRALRARPRHAKRLLVAIGGVDRSGATLRVVRALSAGGVEADVDVVVRDDAPDRFAIAHAAAELGPRTRVFGWLPHLAHRYETAFACVTGGGLTKYEARWLGIPVAAFSQSALEAADTEHMGPGEVLDLAEAAGDGAAALAEALRAFVDEARRAPAAPPEWGADPTLVAAAVLVEGWNDRTPPGIHDAPTAPPF